jgi:hypothetical protein
MKNKKFAPLAGKIPGAGLKKPSQMALVLVVFGVVCLITAGFFSISRGTSIQKDLPLEGGIVGPVEVKTDNTVYLIKVFQYIRKDNDWSAVTGNVLDQDKNYLFGFGQEFWKESGYDSDGRWTESKTKYDMKVTLPKGTYYLEFETDRTPGIDTGISVSVSKKMGSSLPFLAAGILALIIGVVMNEIANQTISKLVEQMED